MNKKKQGISQILKNKILNFVEVLMISRRIDINYQTKFYMRAVTINLKSVAFLPEGHEVYSSHFILKKPKTGIPFRNINTTAID